jgi:hypothetical protein
LWLSEPLAGVGLGDVLDVFVSDAVSHSGCVGQSWGQGDGPDSGVGESGAAVGH